MSNCILKDWAAWWAGSTCHSWGSRTARFEHRELLKDVWHIFEYQRGRGYFQMG